MPGYAVTDLTDSPAEPQPGDQHDSEYMVQMRERFEEARVGWEAVRRDFREDIRFVCGDPTKQWDPQVKGNRDDDGIPALTMDRLNPLVNSIVNQSRKDRPQPKVEPGDGGNPVTAEAIEGKVRHVMYVSHADVAFDCAEAYCASGGIGYYRITKEYSGKRGRNQEPRVRRISDPMSVYFDPGVEEPDYSDAEYCFVRKKYRRKGFTREFKKEPQPFPFPDDLYGNWADSEEWVWVAEYWWVEKIDRGEDEDGRPIFERVVHCDIVDGEKRLEESIWDDEYIPIFPVTGPERIHEGTRRYVSAVRYARDPQAFVNVTMSSTADALATVNKAPYIGAKGQFKDPKWRDGKRHAYLEYEPTNIGGEAVPPPARNAFEPAIQGYTQAALQGIDAIRGAVGYVDSVTQASQADLSGIAVKRRDEQASSANMQYEDSLVQSMWHMGRCLVNLLMKLTDSPRLWQVRKQDGVQRSVPVTMDLEEGTSPYVAGYNPEDHIKIDEGDYGVVVQVGPSYATKQEEERTFLQAMVQGDPQLWMPYADLIFKKFGYEDMQERAELLLPPQIQQAMSAKQGGQNPALLAQQAAQLQAQNQQMRAVLQQVLTILKTKQIETDGKLAVQATKTQGDLHVERLKTIRALIEKSLEHAHDSAKHLLTERTDSVEHMLDLLHESELAPDSMQKPAPGGAGGIQ